MNKHTFIQKISLLGFVCAAFSIQEALAAKAAKAEEAKD